MSNYPHGRGSSSGYPPSGGGSPYRQGSTPPSGYSYGDFPSPSGWNAAQSPTPVPSSHTSTPRAQVSTPRGHGSPYQSRSPSVSPSGGSTAPLPDTYVSRTGNPVGDLQLNLRDRWVQQIREQRPDLNVPDDAHGYYRGVAIEDRQTGQIYFNQGASLDASRVINVGTDPHYPNMHLPPTAFAEGAGPNRPSSHRSHGHNNPTASTSYGASSSYGAFPSYGSSSGTSSAAGGSSVSRHVQGAHTLHVRTEAERQVQNQRSHVFIVNGRLEDGYQDPSWKHVTGGGKSKRKRDD